MIVFDNYSYQTLFFIYPNLIAKPKTSEQIDKAKIPIPALFIYSETLNTEVMIYTSTIKNAVMGNLDTLKSIYGLGIQ